MRRMAEVQAMALVAIDGQGCRWLDESEWRSLFAEPFQYRSVETLAWQEFSEEEVAKLRSGWKPYGPY